MGFEPTTLRDLVGCSNHWATGDSMASKGEMWVFEPFRLPWPNFLVSIGYHFSLPMGLCARVPYAAIMHVHHAKQACS